MDTLKLKFYEAQNSFERDDLQQDILKEVLKIPEKSSYKRRRFFNELVKFIVDEYMENERYDSQTAEAALLAFSENGDMDDVIIRMARNFSLDTRYTKKIIESFDNISELKEVLRRAMSLYPRVFGSIAQTLQVCYDWKLRPSDIEELQYETQFLENISGEDVESISGWLHSQITIVDDFAPVPKWVSLRDGENISLLDTVTTGDSFDKVKAVFGNFIQYGKEMIAEIKPPGKDEEYEMGYDEEKEAIIPAKPRTTVEDAIKTFLAVSGTETLLSKGVDMDHLEFRVWGPENRFLDRDCCAGPEVEDENGIWRAVGPCRMLQCECREYDPDIDGQKYEGGMTWFKGRCDNCYKKIRDMSHAIRFPVRFGGWKGCYCSFKCIRDSPDERIYEEERMSLETMDKYLKEFGIMDRSVL